MMKAGYQGELPRTSYYEFIKQNALKNSWYLEQSSIAMIEYGIAYFPHNHEIGCEYICKAAHHNEINAIYLLAVFQIFIHSDLFTIPPSSAKKITSVDYRDILKEKTPPYLIPYLFKLVQLTQLILKYMNLGYLITPDYILNIISPKCVSLDLTTCEDNIKKNFIPEERRKILLLVENQERKEKSGDKTCQELTKHLLGQEKPAYFSLKSKIAKQSKESKISSQCFSECLSAFFKSGMDLTGEDKKAVIAAEKIHLQHLPGHNPRFFEGGRNQTASHALSIMSEALEKKKDGSETEQTLDFNEKLSGLKRK